MAAAVPPIFEIASLTSVRVEGSSLTGGSGMGVATWLAFRLTGGGST